MDGLDDFRSNGDQSTMQQEQHRPWTKDKFVAIQKQIFDGDEQAAVEALQTMADIHNDEVERSDATIDALSDALGMALNRIDIQVLLCFHQAIVLRLFAPDVPERTVLKVLGRLLDDADKSRQLMSDPAKATAVAIARRLQEAGLNEKIGVLLGPLFFTVTEVTGELLHQLTEAEHDCEARMAVYQTVGASLEAGVHNDNLQPFIEAIKKDLTLDDYLLQISALDLVSDIILRCRTPTWEPMMDYFAPVVYEVMQTARENPDSFVFAGALKCLSELISFSPQSYSSFPDVVPIVVQHVMLFDSLEAIARARAFELFALLVRTPEGKDLVRVKLGNQGLDACMQKFVLAIQSGPVDLKTRHVESLAFLFKNGSDDSSLPYWTSLGTDFPAFTVELIKRPFPELRAAVYSLWQNVLQSDFGVGTLIGTPDFVSWLLPYSGNSWEDAQSWKELCQKLIDHDSTDKILVSRIKSAMLALVNPVAVPEVATQM